MFLLKYYHKLRYRIKRFVFHGLPLKVFTGEKRSFAVGLQP